jgi:serine/threonine-protein kinase HipA
MAMKIGGKYKPDEVFLRHWHRLVPDTKAAQHALNRELKTMATAIATDAIALQQELKEQGIASPVFDSIRQVIEARGKRILIQFSL